jgi:hypothetical protein
MSLRPPDQVEERQAAPKVAFAIETKAKLAFVICCLASMSPRWWLREADLLVGRELRLLPISRR